MCRLQSWRNRVRVSACLRYFSRRANETARFNSEVRSALPVATWTGLPDSLPIHSFNSCAVVLTNRPCRRRGIPSDAHLCTMEVGSPRKAAICCHPLSSSDCALDLGCDDLDFRAIAVSDIASMHANGTK